MSRVINFSPGPATLPTSVLESIQGELLDFQGSGISILEHSHRGKHYVAVHEQTTALLKELLSVPDTHEILFMGAGASGQFAFVPMNFLQGGSADYLDTGTWSKKAFKSAGCYGEPRWAGTGKEGERYVRAPRDLDLSEGAKYVHYTSNATIAGVQFHAAPNASAPLVADMSSDILSRPVDVAAHSLIYAGAQKNLGPAGVTIVIIEKSLMEQGRTNIPDHFQYGLLAAKQSMLNTPPTFPIYCVGKVLQWVKDNGGAEGMAKRNQEKADLLYKTIDDNAEFFRSPVEKGSRSQMNVVFNLPTEDLEKAFIAAAAEEGMVNTKGHRSVGGIRISLYNAIDPAHVVKLTDFMKAFAQKNG